jgi:hypothetical protein
LAWAGIIVIALLWNLFTSSNEPQVREAGFLALASLPSFVLFGLMGIRWGLEAIDRYSGVPTRRFRAPRTRPLQRIATGSIAVFAATLWGGVLLYLHAAVYTTKGIPPAWVPTRYHAIWRDVFEHGVFNFMNTKVTAADTVSQIVGVAGLQFFGLLLLFQGIRIIRDRQRSQIVRNDVREVVRV